MTFKPIHQFFLADFSRSTLINNVSKAVHVLFNIERIFEIETVLVQKSDGRQCARPFVSIPKM